MAVRFPTRPGNPANADLSNPERSRSEGTCLGQRGHRPIEVQLSDMTKLQTPTFTIRTPDDYDGDNRSDLLWHDPNGVKRSRDS